MDQTAENLRRIKAYNKALDEWDESKHPRKANGQFGSGGSKASKPSAKGGTQKSALGSEKRQSWEKKARGLSDKELQEHWNLAGDMINNLPSAPGTEAQRQMLWEYAGLFEKEAKRRGIKLQRKSTEGAAKVDRAYTAKGTQTEADRKVRNNPRYVGNEAVYKLLGGKDKVAYFNFTKSPSTHGNIDKGEVHVQYGEIWNDGGKKRVSTTSTHFDASQIFK